MSSLAHEVRIDARRAGGTLALNNIRKTFGQSSKMDTNVNAVDGVSLNIRRGEFVSILGASGSGKTTLLRILCGLENPTSGAVILDDKDITSSPPEERDMRLVFQDFALFPNLNVYENIAFGLTLRRMRHVVQKNHIPGLVNDFLEKMDLKPHAHKKPNQLSGGQKQRVALSRALITNPSVLLLDEPLGSLDAKIRKQMQIELKRIHKEFEKTFVYVTHDQEEALSMSDKVAVMSGGRLLQFDSPSVIYNSPASRYVAEFIGTNNILDGILSNTPDGIVLKVNDGIQLLVKAGQLPAKEEVSAFIPAEDIDVLPNSETTGTPSGTATILTGTVREILYKGAKVEYLVTVAGLEENLRAHISARRPPLPEGTPVKLHIPCESIGFLQ